MNIIKKKKTIREAKLKRRLIRLSKPKVQTTLKLIVMNKLRRLLRRTPSSSLKPKRFGTFSPVQPFQTGGNIKPVFQKYINKFTEDEVRFARTGRSKIKPKRAAYMIRKMSGLAA